MGNLLSIFSIKPFFFNCCYYFPSLSMHADESEMLKIYSRIIIYININSKIFFSVFFKFDIAVL